MKTGVNPVGQLSVVLRLQSSVWISAAYLSLNLFKQLNMCGLRPWRIMPFAPFDLPIGGWVGHNRLIDPDVVIIIEFKEFLSCELRTVVCILIGLHL